MRETPTYCKVGVAENVDQASCLAVQGLRIYGDADSTFVHLIVRSFFSFRIGGLRKGCVSPTKLLTATTGGIEASTCLLSTRRTGISLMLRDDVEPEPAVHGDSS